MMDYLKKLKQASVSGEGTKLQGPGEYEIEVQNCKEQKSFTAKGNVFLCEFTITETDPSHAQKLPVGKSGSFTVNLQNEMSLGTLLSFLCAASGKDPAKEDVLDDFRDEVGDVLEAALSENVLKGVRVRVQATPRTARDSGKDYTKLTFYPVNA